MIDIVNEQTSEYLKEEDPKLFVSKKSQRGPLDSNWIENFVETNSIMCAYKICKVNICLKDFLISKFNKCFY